MLSSACSTRQIIRNSEYSLSEGSWRAGDIPQALERFPKKEENGFVTSVEKSWLSFWVGEQKHDELVRQAKNLDARNFISVSREAQYFFYSESEDGYIPAEHEVIVMHLINAMYFLRNEKWSEARVEARLAAFILESSTDKDQAYFDDPALRIWLSGIWAALGEWDSSLVDLRRAYEMSKNKSLLPLLKMESPPKDVSIVFSGGGPVLAWKENAPTPDFIDHSAKPTLLVSFPTLPWFLRHEKRNSEIRSVVLKSNYMAQYYQLNAGVGAEKTLGFVASNSLRAAGLILGTAIVGGGIYLLLQGGGGTEDLGYLFAIGLGVGGALWDQGDQVAHSFDKSTKQSKEVGLAQMRTYRFVRFMPSWISIDNTEQVGGLNTISLSFQAPRAKTKVHFLQKF